MTLATKCDVRVHVETYMENMENRQWRDIQIQWLYRSHYYTLILPNLVEIRIDGANTSESDFERAFISVM